MKRILCLIDSLGSGGAQRQIVGLASFLKSKGYDVEVVFYHKKLFFEDVLRQAGVPYTYLEKAETNMVLIPVLSKYIKKVQPDIVISYLELPSMAACMVRLFNHNFKLIVSERNTTQHTGIAEKIRFWMFRIADYVVPNAYAQADYIKSNFPKLASKVVAIPNFVDLQYFLPSSQRVRKVVPEIIIAASIWPPKNTLGFIDAVAQLKKKGYKFHVSWYGLVNEKSAYVEECFEKIKRLAINDVITLKEKTSEIRDCYQKADFFCLPSFYEGTPNVICEAMSCGLPVLCSDVCDNRHYVVDGENGYLFNPHISDEIIVAFEKMFILNDDEYSAFCTRSRTFAEKRLSLDRFVNEYIEIIEA